VLFRSKACDATEQLFKCLRIRFPGAAWIKVDVDKFPVNDNTTSIVTLLFCTFVLYALHIVNVMYLYVSSQFIILYY